jgi:hypothetical protein
MKHFLMQLFLELLLMVVSIDSSVDSAIFVNIVHIELTEIVNG